MCWPHRVGVSVCHLAFSAAINLSPFTKDFLGGEQLNESVDYFFSRSALWRGSSRKKGTTLTQMRNETLLSDLSCAQIVSRSRNCANCRLLIFHCNIENLSQEISFKNYKTKSPAVNARGSMPSISSLTETINEVH